MINLLEVKNLTVKVEDKLVVNDLNLSIKEGEVHAIMGPNGSGKSSLALTLMGHPRYRVVCGEIYFKGEDMATHPPFKRAKEGLFLSFQYPYEVEGVPFIDFLRQAYNGIYGGTDKQIGPKSFRELVQKKMNIY